MTSRLTMTAALALAGLLALGACGRKGDLEPPPYVSPDMAAKPAGCAAAPEGSQPIDATPSPMIPSGNPTQTPENAATGC